MASPLSEEERKILVRAVQNCCLVLRPRSGDHNEWTINDARKGGEILAPMLIPFVESVGKNYFILSRITDKEYHAFIKDWLRANDLEDPRRWLT